ncbi:GAF domain-containing protein, partial [bacterium]|nr:GAF domain-containing protein [bacterium]
RHGGRIWGERVQPRGVRFNALLPRRDEIIRRGKNKGRHAIFGDVPEFAEKLIHWIGELMRVRIVSLMVPDQGGEHLVIEAAMGLEDAVVQDTRLLRGEGIAGRVWMQGEAILVEDVATDERVLNDFSRPRYETGSLLSAPIRRDDQIVGVVNVNNRLDGQQFTERDKLLLDGLSARLGHILARVGELQRGNREFANLSQALRKSVAIRRARHDELAEVCHEICIAAAQRMHLQREDLMGLAFALQTYDLGLSGIPDDILHKTPPLEPEEWEIIQQHVHISLEMIKSLNAPADVHEVVLYHHEQYDGSGYPEGLSGDGIPLGSRLLSLADSMTAMLQGRPYRRAMSLGQALAEIEQRAGKQFCPRCVAIYVEQARNYEDRIVEIQKARSLAAGAVEPDRAPEQADQSEKEFERVK